MSGRRRIQRSVRLTVASSLVILAAGLVALAIATSTWIDAAAGSAVVLAAAATRIGSAEVTATRRIAANDRAAQARTFGAAWAERQREHSSFTAAIAVLVQDQQRTLVGLEGTLRLADRRADEAESRVQREARRATDAEQRLSSLLDELLIGHSGASNSGQDEQQAAVAPELTLVDSSESPTVIDLLAWENRARGSRRGSRKQA